MRKVDQIKANMDRHLQRWRSHTRLMVGDAYLAKKRWYAEWYRGLLREYAKAINEDDSIIGKQYLYDHTRAKDFDDLLQP